MEELLWLCECATNSLETKNGILNVLLGLITRRSDHLTPHDAGKLMFDLIKGGSLNNKICRNFLFYTLGKPWAPLSLSEEFLRPLEELYFLCIHPQSRFFDDNSLLFSPEITCLPPALIREIYLCGPRLWKSHIYALITGNHSLLEENNRLTALEVLSLPKTYTTICWHSFSLSFNGCPFSQVLHHVIHDHASDTKFSFPLDAIHPIGQLWMTLFYHGMYRLFSMEEQYNSDAEKKKMKQLFYEWREKLVERSINELRNYISSLRPSEVSFLLIQSSVPGRWYSQLSSSSDSLLQSAHLSNMGSWGFLILRLNSSQELETINRYLSPQSYSDESSLSIKSRFTESIQSTRIHPLVIKHPLIIFGICVTIFQDIIISRNTISESFLFSTFLLLADTVFSLINEESSSFFFLQSDDAGYSIAILCADSVPVKREDSFDSPSSFAEEVVLKVGISHEGVLGLLYNMQLSNYISHIAHKVKDSSLSTPHPVSKREFPSNSVCAHRLCIFFNEYWRRFFELNNTDETHIPSTKAHCSSRLTLGVPEYISSVRDTCFHLEAILYDEFSLLRKNRVSGMKLSSIIGIIEAVRHLLGTHLLWCFYFLASKGRDEFLNISIPTGIGPIKPSDFVVSESQIFFIQKHLKLLRKNFPLWFFRSPLVVDFFQDLYYDRKEMVSPAIWEDFNEIILFT